MHLLLRQNNIDNLLFNRFEIVFMKFNFEQSKSLKHHNKNPSFSTSRSFKVDE